MDMKYSLLDLPRVFWRISSFCDIKSICTLMQLNSKANTLATHDNVWKEVLSRANLDATLMVFVSSQGTEKSSSPMSIFQFFVEYFVSPRILCGSYSFLASSDDDSGGAYSIQEAQVAISLAKLGCPSPRHVTRAQLVLRYTSGQPEVLEGVVRYSAQRQAFILCTCVNGCTARGPTFIVVLTRGTRRWANQNPTQFQKHQGGIRLVMTPIASPECTNNKFKGSQITCSDIIAVSRGVPTSVSSPNSSPGNSPSASRRQFAMEEL